MSMIFRVLEGLLSWHEEDVHQISQIYCYVFLKVVFNSSLNILNLNCASPFKHSIKQFMRYSSLNILNLRLEFEWCFTRKYHLFYVAHELMFLKKA